MIRARKQEQAVLYWRPNFRDADRLPDIKTVRTSFFLSSIAIMLAAMIVIFVGTREYKIVNLKKNIEDIQKEIDVYRVENAHIVNKNKVFRDNSLKIQEIVKFVEEKVVVSDLVISVAGALSPGMEFNKFEYTEEGAKFEGTIPAGLESEDSLNSFIASLKNIESLNRDFKEFNQTSVVRQQETGDVDFVIDIVNDDGKNGRRKK